MKMPSDQGRHSELLDAEVDRVIEKSRDVLREHVGTVDDPEDDPYAQALEAINSMDRQTTNTLEDDISVVSLEAALRDFLGYIEEEQEYAEKVDSDAARDRLWWFKLHAGGMLEQAPQIERGPVIELLTELSNEGRHEQGMTGSSDPVIVSTLVYLWRVVDTVLDYWEDLIPYSGFEFMQSELVPNQGHVGFIRSLDRVEGTGVITSYQQGGQEEGIQFRYTQVDFFPATGDLVHVIGEDSLPRYAGTPVDADEVEEVRLLL